MKQLLHVYKNEIIIFMKTFEINYIENICLIG
jgi:hypothetical protein